MRVLIIDDNKDIRLLLRVLLDIHNHEVVGEGENGREGLQLAYEHQPDVVLLDLFMPQMDGLTTVSLLKKTAPKSQIVIVSGSLSGAESLAAGIVQAVVQKDGDLVRQLPKVLDELRTMREAEQ